MKRILHVLFESMVGLSGRAIVLGFLRARASYFFIITGQGPTVLAVDAGSAHLEIFSHPKVSLRGSPI